METSLSLIIKLNWRSKVGEVLPSFYLNNGGQSSPWCVFLKSVRQEWFSIHRNKRTNSSQIQNYPLQILSFSFGGKVLKKANLKMKYSKSRVSVWFAQPSLLNIPLLWQDLHGKCILKCPGSQTSSWQMMDGSNATPGIQNDKVQKWRGWVTVAKEMNRPGTFTAEGWITYCFMKRIMNEVTTAGIHFQPGIFGFKNP